MRENTSGTKSSLLISNHSGLLPLFPWAWPVASCLQLGTLILFAWFSDSFSHLHAQSLQSCSTLCNPMDCSPPRSSVHGILQTRILEWVAIPFSRGFSWPRDRTQVSSIAGRFFTIWASRETNLLPPCSKAHYLLSEFQEEPSTHCCFHLCLSPASFPTQLPHNFFSTIAKPISFKISMTLFYSKPSGTPDFTENRS